MDSDWPEVAYNPPLANTHFYNFEFAGWKFHDSGLVKPLLDNGGDQRRVGHLRLNAILHNPEAPNLYLAYHSYSEAPSYLPEREKADYDWRIGKYFAAAWLIAHWYEHYFHNCPCLMDDHKPSHFRFAFIETMLYMLS